jgi:hypothetical protein
VVDDQPKALRGIESQWQVEAKWNQSRTDGPQLWSATATVPNARDGSTVHSGSIKETAGGMAVLRRACALTPATVYRLDRIRQARGDKGQASAGGDSPPYCRQTAGTQVNSRQQDSIAVPDVQNGHSNGTTSVCSSSCLSLLDQFKGLFECALGFDMYIGLHANTLPILSDNRIHGLLSDQRTKWGWS